MKNWITILVILTLLVILMACTQQDRAKRWGGKAEIILPVGEKLITATWKESNLWHLTRPMRPGEIAENYIFQESSSYGIIEGKIIIRERQK